MTGDELRRALMLLPSEATIALPARELLSALQSLPNAVTTITHPVTPSTDASGKRPGVGRWLGAKEVAKALGVSPRYVNGHRRSFPFGKALPGGTVRFSERGLQAWMERSR